MKNEINIRKSPNFLQRLVRRQEVDFMHAFINSAELQKIKSQRALLGPQDSNVGIFLIISGSGVITKLSHDKEIVIRFLGEGDLVGFQYLFECDEKDTAFRIIEPNSLVAYMSSEKFFDLLKKHPESYSWLFKYIHHEISSLEDRAIQNRRVPSIIRLKLALSLLYNKYGQGEEGEINIECTPSEMAKFIGVTKTTIYRQIKKLELEKILSWQGTQIFLKNPEELISG